MNRGYVKLYRKSLDAGWIKNHKLWAFWSWCLLKATHKEFDAVVGLQTIHLLPGQFIFGRDKAAEETGLTPKEVRGRISFLRRNGNMATKKASKFSVITIINWDTYQGECSEKGHQKGKRRANKRPHTNTEEHKEENPPDFSSEISALENRYPDQETINQAFTAIVSTRKSNRIAHSVKLSILKAWESYPVESVMAGIRTYLEKGYHDQGKGEKYLLGIIRNLKPEDSMTGGQVRKSTGSPLLDDHYRSQGIRII